MRFPEGGTPRVITFGGQGPTQRQAMVPYTDDPATGLRWVAMDHDFLNDFVPAMAQQNVAITWVEDRAYIVALKELALLLNIELDSVSVGAIVNAAVERLQDLGGSEHALGV